MILTTVGVSSPTPFTPPVKIIPENRLPPVAAIHHVLNRAGIFNAHDMTIVLLSSASDVNDQD
jgi:hypothetical protein